jgi:hypothetical protein
VFLIKLNHAGFIIIKNKLFPLLPSMGKPKAGVCVMVSGRIIDLKEPDRSAYKTGKTSTNYFAIGTNVRWIILDGNFQSSGLSP